MIEIARVRRLPFLCEIYCYPSSNTYLSFQTHFWKIKPVNFVCRFLLPFFQFEQENQRLVGEMNNLFDEVRYSFLSFDRQWPVLVPCPSQPPCAGHWLQDTCLLLLQWCGRSWDKSPVPRKGTVCCPTV